MRRVICNSTYGSIAGFLLLGLLIALPADAAYRQVEGGIEFSYSDPSASSVHIAGAFNDWSTSATPLDGPDAAGKWSVVVPLSAGTHEYKFVVNGGTWVADPDNPQTGGDYDNSIVVVGGDGGVVVTQPKRPNIPSGTPVLSNTPLHGKVYVGGFFRMLMEGHTDSENDARLRVDRPEDQFNLDVNANLSEKIWGSVRLQVRTGEGGANELSTDLYKAQTNFIEDQFQVKAFYNDEVYSSDDPLGLLGEIDLRGTMVEEERSFGQGQQGVLLQTQPFGGDFDFLYSDTYDEDIFNRNEPTVLDPRKDGLNQNTGTDLIFSRWSRPVGKGRIGVSYRGEFSDWWVNFTKAENLINDRYPLELEEHRDETIRPADDQKSDNFELTNDRQFGAIDYTRPLPRDIVLATSIGYGWYSTRWDLGNRETVQGQGFVNGNIDIPIGSQNFYRGRLQLDGNHRGVQASLGYEYNFEQGMSAGQSEVMYRTQPGSTIDDRDRFATQRILAKYQDVNGTDALDILRLGPAPELQSHEVEFDLDYGWNSWVLDMELDWHRSNLGYAVFDGSAENFDRRSLRWSPRVRWQPFANDRHHVSLGSEVWFWKNPKEFDELAAGETEPALPAQGYGSLIALDSTELVLDGKVPVSRVLRYPLDLRFDMRYINYSGPRGLMDDNNIELDLNQNFLSFFAALAYEPMKNVLVEVGLGVDPRFYDVISPSGWENGRQQFRDRYLTDQRLDPYNPINVLKAEQELEDRLQFVINALVSF